jgi:hypothetical protein
MSLLILLALAGVALVLARRHRLALLAVAFVILSVPTTAVAAESVDGSDTIASLRLSALTVQVVLALVIPIVTGLLTKYSVPSAVKGLTTLVLNAVAALVTTATLADGTAVISKPTFIAWMLGLVVSVATYAGVYAPAGLTSSRPDGKLAPNFGIGHSEPEV